MKYYASGDASAEFWDTTPDGYSSGLARYVATTAVLAVVN
jgi:hypothetical protein